jgi:Family of unknown function (DUF5763)
MSRVRDALKKANSMQTPSAQTEAISEVFGNGAAAEDLTEGAAPPELSASSVHPRPKYHPLLRHRWVRKLLHLAGLHPNLPVQKCRGLTRMGQPCRGPAMANGFCRLHGGSRHSAVVEKTRELIERVMPAR